MFWSAAPSVYIYSHEVLLCCGRLLKRFMRNEKKYLKMKN